MGRNQFPGREGTGTGAASCTGGCGTDVPDPDAVREALCGMRPGMVGPDYFLRLGVALLCVSDVNVRR